MFIPNLKETFELVFKKEYSTLTSKNKICYLLLTYGTKPARRCESPLPLPVLSHNLCSTAFNISRVFYRIFRNPNRGQPQLVRIPEIHCIWFYYQNTVIQDLGLGEAEVIRILYRREECQKPSSES
ncbi:hypothetical protein AVEN_59233-1 [Araneus ventricosus]|uniref:Uncharacterized protein n=1 Tax=Araneus ventricosus TaxID=182803 RepID=A0A4Y2CXZ4_ARAVE|nr:hypothetical protein AVEN_59233-1 [Araneus ventricosus]